MNAYSNSCFKVWCVGPLILCQQSTATEYACDWSGLHFKETIDAFSDGASMEFNISLCLFFVFFEKFMNNYVYTQGAYFSDISGVAKLFHVHIHIHAS